MSGDAFDAVFYPGGHGPLWDLAEDTYWIKLIETMASAGKTVAAVCHAPAVFRHTRASNGQPLVHGRHVTGFTNSEEETAQLTEVVPFLVQDMLVENGGQYSNEPDWQPHVVTDGKPITGQDPASSAATARSPTASMKSPMPSSKKSWRRRRPASPPTGPNAVSRHARAC